MSLGMSEEQAKAVGIRTKRIYIRQEYPKMCEHPDHLSDRSKDVRCENEEAEIEFLYGFTEDGKKELAAKKEKEAEEAKALAGKRSAVDELRSQVYAQKIDESKDKMQALRSKANKEAKDSKEAKEPAKAVKSKKLKDGDDPLFD